MSETATTPSLNPPPPPAAGPDSPPRSWRPAMISLAILAPAALGCVGLFHVLKRLDNSPDNYKEYGDTIGWGALGVGVVVALISAAIFHLPAAQPLPHLRRAARTAITALVLGLVFWWAPVPFALTRLMTYILLAFAGARLAIAALRPTSATAPIWLPPLAAVAAAAMTARVLLLIKLNELGWAFAID